MLTSTTSRRRVALRAARRDPARERRPVVGPPACADRARPPLADSIPPHLELLAAPFDVTLDDTTQLQPDLLVAPREQFTAKNLPGPPLLVVEIASPSTRLIDRNLKKARFEEAGCASFWVVDPLEPRLTAWKLVDGAYVEVADVSGDESWTASAPYAVTVRPAALVG